VQRIRVLVANRPTLMRELIMATIADQPDIEVTGELDDDSLIVGAVEEGHPDFLIIALDESGKPPKVCDGLLRLHPRLRILAVAPERNSSVLLSAAVQIHRTAMQVSEEAILSVLRTSSPPESNGLIDYRKVN
jgi:chemotaxis response regulator CheB